MKGARQRPWARPRWRIGRGSTVALGPGKADLLREIDRTGSISSAARALGMSYRRAWLLVETMNRCFTRPLVATSRWRGRGAWLTPEGRKAASVYRRIEARSLATARTLLLELRRLLKPSVTGYRSRRRPRST